MQNYISDLNVIAKSSNLNKIIQVSWYMEKTFLIIGLIFSLIITVPVGNAQVFEKATLQESAIVVYDQKLSGSVIASIGLETTNNEEIKFPDELIQKVNDNEKIRALVFTNAGECVIGITTEEQCIMINFNYQELKGDGGIRQVQDSARDMGNEIITSMNELLGTNAEFHSTFIHTVDDANMLLETSGAISGRGAVSATYTMPKQSTDFLFVDLAGKLISKEIRDGGGFYDVAKDLADDEEAIISISMIRNQEDNLFMFKVSVERENASEDISRINVLKEFQINQIARSDVFEERNVPLNSVIQLVVIPNEMSKIDAISTHAITDVTKIENIMEKGWFFSNAAGNKIDAKFLFGQDKIVLAKDLRVEIGKWDGGGEMSFYSVETIQEETYESIDDFVRDDEEEDVEQSQYVVLGIIIVVGIGAAVFYLKGYKPKR